MATIITQTSNPTLWAVLNSSYLSQDRPHTVLAGSSMYVAYENTSGEVEFKLIDTIDYIDSRSLKNSKKATYGNLDNG